MTRHREHKEREPTSAKASRAARLRQLATERRLTVRDAAVVLRTSDGRLRRKIEAGEIIVEIDALGRTWIPRAEIDRLARGPVVETRRAR